ncbi:hypothetical protein STSP2_01395 [Anaerohalosphaera lusitana]|uniref:Uncharacterized protein n=1 Tax=Anaerohalosphaera lusitana TaxID=1936003 RepID=A0A1U9NK05_9BACT|nr:hypothetical protein [Anaerohalosphaera lusitana]AQT68239.1 hypothetical protein STSP2_01395 [Anaerohalosphaera lusitana]
MAGKPKTPTYHNGRLLDAKDDKGNRVHVAFEQSYSGGRGGYVLRKTRKGKTVRKKCFGTHKNREKALANAASLFEKYVGTVASERTPIAQHNLQVEKTGDYKITWIHLYENDADIIEKLSNFYNEWNPLTTEEGEEPISIKDLHYDVYSNDYELQAIYNWWDILSARETTGEDETIEPVFDIPRPFFNFCHWESHIFTVFNWAKHKPLILEHICKQVNSHANNTQLMTKEELKEELFAIGMVVEGDDEWIESKLKEAREYWTDERRREYERETKKLYPSSKVYWVENKFRVITEDEFNQHFEYPLLKTDGVNVTRNRRKVDKFYIMDEAIKLIENNPSEFANYTKISGITKPSQKKPR